MQVKSFHIERFGALQEQNVEALSPGLNIILGLNEAGKSTTLNFFRAIFCGYNRNRRQLDPRAEKNRGGGSLWLRSRDLGEVRLLRRPGPHGGKAELFDAQGHKLPDSSLMRLLHGINPSLFDNVYGFSLKELQAIDSLQGEEVSRVFSGAMAGLGSISPADALERLDKEMKELYAPRSGRIVQSITALERLQREIQDLGPALPRYLDLGTEKSRLEAEKNILSVEARELRRQKSELDLLRLLHPKWQELCRLRGEFAELRDPGLNLALDAQERLESLLVQKEERLLSVREKQRELDVLRQNFSQVRADLQAHAGLLEDERRILGLVEGKEKYRRSVEEMLLLDTEQQHLRDKLRNCLSGLGQDWNLQRVEGFDRSLSNREQINRHEENLQKASQQLEAAKAEEATLEKGFIETQAELFSYNERLDEQNRRLSDQTGALPAEFFTPERSGMLDELGKRQGQAQNVLQNQAELKVRIREGEHALQQRLTQISRFWDKDFLGGLDFSTQARHGFIQDAEAVRQAEAAYRETGRDFENIENICNEQQERIAVLTAELEEYSDLPEVEDLEDTRSALRQLRQRMQDLEQARRYWKDAESKLSEFVQAMPEDPALTRDPWWQRFHVLPVCAVLLALGAVGLIGAGVYLVRDMFSFMGMGLGIMSTIVFAACYIGARQRKEFVMSVEQLAKKEAELIEERNSSKDEVDELMEDLPELLQCSGLNVLCSDRLPALELSRAEENIEQLLELALQKERLNRELLPLQSQQDKSAYALENAAMEMAEAAAALEEARTQWSERLQLLRLEKELSPENALAVLGEGELLRSRLEGIRELETQLQRQKVWLREFWQDALKVLPPDALKELREAEGQQGEAMRAVCDAGDPGNLGDSGDFARLFAALHKLGQARILVERWRQDVEKTNENILFCQKRLDRQGEHLLKAREQLEQCALALQERQAHWDAWLKGQGLKPGIAAESARQAFALAQEALDISLVIKDKADKKSTLQKWCEHFVRTLGQIAGLDPATLTDQEQTLYHLDQLRESLERGKELTTRSNDLGDKEQSVTTALQTESDRLSSTQEGIAELLTLGKAESPEEFRANFAAMQKLRNTQESLSRIQTELQVACAGSTLLCDSGSNATDTAEDKEAGGEASIDAVAEVAALVTAPGGLLARRLNGTPLDSIEHELRELAEKIEQVTAQEHELSSRQGEVKTEMQVLETGNRIADLRLQEENIREELGQMTEQWLRLSIARRILANTKRRLEEERLPGLILEAGELFRTFTNGAYSQLSLSMNEPSLSAASVQAMTGSGQVLHQDALSQGAREQLYLSLRLAYIHEHSRHADPLPLIMDDILVNFDPERARQSARVLAEFCRGGQTHKSDFAGLSAGHGPESDIVQGDVSGAVGSDKALPGSMPVSAMEYEGAAPLDEQLPEPLAGQQIFFFTCHPSTADMLREAAPDAGFLRLENGRFSRPALEF